MPAARTATSVIASLCLVATESPLSGADSAHDADGFCASRLDADRGQVLGTLPAGLDVGSVIERAQVKSA